MNEPKYLTVKQVASELQVHEHTVRKYIKNGELPAIELGGQYRITPEDLQAFLKKHRKQSPS